VQYIYDNTGNLINELLVGSPLPIYLLSFDAMAQGKTVLLKWVTSQEVNADRFEVEFSINAVNFYKFASVQARGNTSSNTNYNTVHCCPVVGTNYYRLKLIDKDGQFKYSEVRKVSFDSENTFVVYPSPVSGSSSIGIKFGKMLTENANVCVYGSNGTKALTTTFSKGQTAYQLPVKNLSAGTYYIVVYTTNDIFQATFVKQ
jgi:Secretion system C-terminal sorting domain